MMQENDLNSYILLVDDEQDLLDSYSVIVKSKTKFPYKTAKSGNQAIEILKQFPHPALIVSDFSMSDGTGGDLYNAASKMGLNCPFVICSGNDPRELRNTIPNSVTIIEKPDVLKSFINLIERVSSPPLKPIYVTIQVSIWSELEILPTDIYIKLAEDKFVKFAKKADHFTKEDSHKLHKKNIKNLYFPNDQLPEFFRAYSAHIEFERDYKNQSSEVSFEKGKSLFAAAYNLYHSMGWSDDFSIILKNSFEKSIALMESHPKLLELFEKQQIDAESYLTTHGHYTSIISCMLASSLGWHSNFTFAKLTLASMIHDITIPNTLGNSLPNPEWEKNSQYLSHPSDAVRLLENIPYAPPDVAEIIISHHEKPDNTGFPNKLSFKNIPPLAAIFIIAHDLAKELWLQSQKKNQVMILKDFISSRRNYYIGGHFKKIFAALESEGTEETIPPKIF